MRLFQIVRGAFQLMLWSVVAGPALLLAGCAKPLGPVATIRYHQVGACNGIGAAEAGDNHAFVVFAIDAIDNRATQIDFKFDPARLYATDAGAHDFIDPSLPAAQQTLAAHQIAKATIAQGKRATFGAASFGMLLIHTVAKDGASEEDQSNAPLYYDAQSGDPPIVLERLNPLRGAWPSTPGCGQIALGLPNFVYAANWEDQENSTISGGKIDPDTGALTAMPAKFPADASPVALIVDPTARFLYAPTQNSTVTAYTVDQTTGALTSFEDMQLLGDMPTAAAAHPSGAFLYVVGAAFKAVHIYGINQGTGALTEIQGPSVGGGNATGAGPSSITIEPGGRFAYVLNHADANISSYSIAPKTGLLTPIGNPVPATGFWIMADPGGPFVFVRDKTSIATFRIDPNSGALSSVATIAYQGQQSYGMDIDPFGAKLYVTSATGSPALVFAIDQQGKLTPVAQPAPANASQPWAIAIDRTGSFAYLNNWQNQTVSGYAIDRASGTLSAVGPTIPTGMLPNGGVTATGPLK
jgi:6-phosphogluconolactonase (cycloisomerase 2 family)